MILEVVRSSLKVLPPTIAGRVAFELWRRPFKRGQVRESEREVHEAATVEVVDGVVTYAWGDGARPVLLVHGWRSRASRFHKFVTRLVELGYSPVSYDAPGHGDSPARPARSSITSGSSGVCRTGTDRSRARSHTPSACPSSCTRSARVSVSSAW